MAAAVMPNDINNANILRIEFAPQVHGSGHLTVELCLNVEMALGRVNSPVHGALKGIPSSLVQLRSAVWTGDTRDTNPN
jgi:hypothetical protein